MTYTSVSDTTLLQPGVTIQVKFSFDYVPFTAPGEGKIRELLQSAPSLSIVTLDESQLAQLTSLGREWTLEAVTVSAIPVTDIKAEIEMAIEQAWNIGNVGFHEVTRGSFTFIPNIPSVPVTTTMTMVSIAIIAIVGIVLVQKVT